MQNCTCLSRSGPIVLKLVFLLPGAILTHGWAPGLSAPTCSPAHSLVCPMGGGDLWKPSNLCKARLAVVFL